MKQAQCPSPGLQAKEGRTRSPGEADGVQVPCPTACFTRQNPRGSQLSLTFGHPRTLHLNQKPGPHTHSGENCIIFDFQSEPPDKSAPDTTPAQARFQGLMTPEVQPQADASPRPHRHPASREPPILGYTPEVPTRLSSQDQGLSQALPHTCLLAPHVSPGSLSVSPTLTRHLRPATSFLGRRNAFRGGQPGASPDASSLGAWRLWWWRSSPSGAVPCPGPLSQAPGMLGVGGSARLPGPCLGPTVGI